MKGEARFGRWLAPLWDRTLAICTLLTAALLIGPWLPFSGHVAMTWLSGALHLALVVMVFTVLNRRRTVAPRSAERGFWLDLIWAAAIWMTADLLLVVAEMAQLPELSVITRLGGGLAWLAVWLAATRTPHRLGHWRPRQVERTLHVAGAVVVVLGSMVYLVGPTFLDGLEAALLATWLLLSVIAVLVLSRLVFLTFEARDDRWRGVYGVLAFAAALIAWSHISARLGPEPPASAVLGGPWAAITLTLLVVCARLDQMHHDEETGTSIGDPIEEGPQRLEVPYLALAIAVPLTHYVGSRTGLFDPAFEALREQIMIFWSPTLAMVSVYQQRRLELWAAKTLDERGRLERSLQASRRRLQIMEEREQAEDAIESTKMVYTKAFSDNSWAVVLTSKEDGRHLECNDQYLDIIGFRREEVIGRTTIELGIWGDSEMREHMLEELAATGAVRSFEFLFRRRDGELRPALFSAETVEIDGETCLLSVSRDLSEERLLRGREETLAAILDELPHALWRLDLHDRVVAANPAAERVAGPISEQRGRPLFDGLAQEAAVRRLTQAAVQRGWCEDELSLAGQPRIVLVTLVRDPYGLPNGKLVIMRHNDP